MNTTQAVRDLLDTSDTRVNGRIGNDALFTDRCDDCDLPATVLTETVLTLALGASREGGIYCLDCAIDAIDLLTDTAADEITVTVPASLIATDQPAAA
jgi:hypothetical protein